MEQSMDLYEVLGVSRSATFKEIRRTFRTLATKLHPDRAGSDSAEAFKAVQKAYEVLSDTSKRQLYDATGMVEKSADEELRESFAGGSFKDRAATLDDLQRPGLDALIAKQHGPTAQSHSSGFQAWLRARDEDQGSLFNADSVADAFGVTKSSYDAVPLPKGETMVVRVEKAGKPADVMQLASEGLPHALEWGCVLVEWRYAPINPSDLYSARTGGTYGSDTSSLPYVGGHNGVGVVAKVGPGVKNMAQGDVVLPAHKFMGTWRSAAAVKEADLIKLPQHLTALITDRSMEAAAGAEQKAGNGDGAKSGTTSTVGGGGSGRVGLEMLALAQELGLAFLLLERHGNLKAGDCVLLNSATSTVGQALLQLCKLLQLRAVAVARPPSVIGEQNGCAPDSAVAEVAWQRTEAWLKKLGATVVVKDQASVKVVLDSIKFFGRPKLALDAVGGQSAARLVEALAEGGEVVCYGCASGQAPQWTWQSFVFRDLKVSGFNMRRWMMGGQASGGLLAASTHSATATKRFVPVLESLLKLIDAGLLVVAYTEYDLMEFSEALDHALSPGHCTKVLLRMPPMVVHGEAPAV